MKAKPILQSKGKKSPNRERPEPLAQPEPAKEPQASPPESVPFNEERWDELLPFEKDPYFLAEARLKCEHDGAVPYENAIDWLLRKAAALCDMVADAEYGMRKRGMKDEVLTMVADIIREQIEVANVLVSKMPKGPDRVA